VNLNPAVQASLTDLIRLVKYLVLFGKPLACHKAADIDANNAIKLIDLTLRVNHWFVMFPTTAFCP